MSDPEVTYEQLQRKLIDTVADVVTGTDWAPPEGAVLTECVVIMGWFYPDGTYGSSHLRCGAPWGTFGLTEQAAARMRRQDAREDVVADDG